jgi:predicted nucleic acid-binding protein
VVIVDTNVVAELMKTSPAPAVVSWMNDQPTAELFLTAVTLGEIFYGLRAMPAGARRVRLEQAFEHVVRAAFEERILAFDEEAARHYGEVMGRRREIGRPMSVLDGQIAAIARANGCAVATRNTRDFVDCGIEIVNPFAAI